jgi:hypothetical protein
MQIRKYVGAAVVVFLSVAAFGDVQYEQGQAALTYSGKSAPASVRDQAQQLAQMRAIETHYAKAGDSEQTNFDLIRSKVAENLDHYILEALVVDEAYPSVLGGRPRQAQSRSARQRIESQLGGWDGRQIRQVPHDFPGGCAPNEFGDRFQRTGVHQSRYRQKLKRQHLYVGKNNRG